MSKLEDLLVNKGLYEKIEICEDDFTELNKLTQDQFFQSYRIDSFCVECNEKRTFESVDKEIHSEHSFVSLASISGEEETLSRKFTRLLNKRYCISFRCTRDTSHIILFDLITTDKHIIKIGQYPTYADISIGDIKKYKSVLKEEFIEYSKAIGLFSHGIGIGSFVYLRRIIEKLVFSKFELYKSNIEKSEEEFKRSDFKQKIEIVKEYLPSILVETKNIYSILSLGVHELDEEKCKEMFPYMKLAIELILDDIISEREREKKEKMIKNKVAKIVGELS